MDACRGGRGRGYRMAPPPARREIYRGQGFFRFLTSFQVPPADTLLDDRLLQSGVAWTFQRIQ
jgi:hypothetical protein